MSVTYKSYVVQAMERLSEDLLMAAQIASASAPHDGLCDVIGKWSMAAHSCLGTFQRLEAENAELREKLASAEKERDHWKANHDEQVRKNKILRERPDLPAERLEAYRAIEAENAELRETITNAGALALQRDNEIKNLREKLAATEKERDRWRHLSDANSGECDKLEAELARLKSHEGQWAVTTPRMSKESAERYAGLMADHGIQGRSDWFPVPLAPEDGPWVVMVYTPGRERLSYWSGHADYYTASTEDAAKLDTHAMASESAKEYERKYGTEAWPVRLSDVAPGE